MSDTTSESSIDYRSPWSSSDKEDDDLVLNLLLEHARELAHRRGLPKQPYHTSALRGFLYERELMDGHPGRFRQVLRMDKATFKAIMTILQPHLEDTIHISANEQFMIFLYIVGNASTNATAAERWPHSGETVSRYYNKVVNVLESLKDEIIVQPGPDSIIPSEISESNRFSPFFDGCIGALDGTHIPVKVPVEDQPPYRNRKGLATQNVLASCSFDLTFSFVLAGFEGSTSDPDVLYAARHDGDFVIPEGRFYLGDTAYANGNGILAPYRGFRYHIQEWARGRTAPQNYQELFNYRHSQLRMIIERIFGVLKIRFVILVLMRRFPIHRQGSLVIALIVLHNLIMRGGEDQFFNEFDQEQRVRDQAWVQQAQQDFVPPRRRDRAAANAQRDDIAERMWAHYRDHRNHH